MRPVQSPQGFTLIEIMIVLAVIGILAAIAIPKYSENRQRAQDNAVKAALHSLAKAEENYYIQNATYTSDKAKLSTSSGWSVENTISITILSASSVSWSATGRHTGSPKLWKYESANGGIQP